MDRFPFYDSYRAPHPYVNQVLCDDFIFTSGQLDVDGQGRLQHEGDLHGLYRGCSQLLAQQIQLPFDKMASRHLVRQIVLASW